MEGFKKILSPVQLSQISAKSVPYVTLLAKQFQADIHLVYVARVFDPYIKVYVSKDSVSKFQSELAEGAQKRLLEFKEKYYKDFPEIRTSVVSGDISEEILNYVESNGIDLVVMGTNTRKGVDKVIFGSVAEKVVRLSPVPIFLVKTHE
ncbi:universal stress protein [Desulfococcaceae bacterium HSG8]|nr:universal stress protein [Desulfococcaceae bacterium HSG8]